MGSDYGRTRQEASDPQSFVGAARLCHTLDPLVSYHMVPRRIPRNGWRQASSGRFSEYYSSDKVKVLPGSK